MISTAPVGNTDRITARISVNLLRAGSGTRAKYSSTFFGPPLPVAEAFLPWLRTGLPLVEALAALLADFPTLPFVFLVRVMLQTLLPQVHAVACGRRCISSKRGLAWRIPGPTTRDARLFIP